MSNVPNPYQPNRVPQQSPYQPPRFNAPPPMPGPAGPMPISKVLFSFDGRIPRRTWWLWRILTLLPIFVLAGIFAAVSPSEVKEHRVRASATPQAVEVDPDTPSTSVTPTTPATPVHHEPSPLAGAMLIVFVVVLIPFIWISLAISIKRWHDRGKSGAWIFISIIPYIGGIWSFVECGCLRGTYGPNLYGPDPN